MRRRFGLLIRVIEGERLPMGYGVAWDNWETHSAMCAPVGLHVVFGWVRAQYRRFRLFHVNDAIDAAYARGFRAAQDQALRVDALRLATAEQRGYDRAFADMHRAVDARSINGGTA